MSELSTLQFFTILGFVRFRISAGCGSVQNEHERVR